MITAQLMRDVSLAFALRVVHPKLRECTARGTFRFRSAGRR
jgi:hypothetical protein